MLNMMYGTKMPIPPKKKVSQPAHVKDRTSADSKEDTPIKNKPVENHLISSVKPIQLNIADIEQIDAA